MNWRDWLNTLMGILYPTDKICPFCSQKVSGMEYKGVCSNCIEKILDISRNEDICPRCGYFTAGEECSNCRHWVDSPLKVASVAPYEEKFREVMYNFKYKGKKEISRALGYIMACRLQNLGISDCIQIVVPVPLHATREIDRGYNQSLLIAQAVAAELHKPLWTGVLERKFFYNSQTQLHKEERLKNLDGAIKCKELKDAKDKSILLVDDVITTGATLLACTKALKRAGADQIYGVTWAAGYNTKLMGKFAGIHW